MASRKGPGKAFREGMTLAEFFEMYPDEQAAERFFVEQRWPAGVRCVFCGSDNVQTGAAHHMPYRCRERDCRKRFSTRTRGIMEGSNLNFKIWLTAIFLITTNLKGVSSMKLHRDLGITQKSAWFLAHRIRTAMNDDDGYPLMGPVVEVDETFVGGLRKNMSHKKRKKVKNKGRGTAGKTIVAGVKDRKTNQIKAAVIPNTSQETLHHFVEDRVHHEATVYSDDQPAYGTMVYFEHDSVTHSKGEYVKKDTDVHNARHRVLLVDAQTRPQGHVPQDEPQAHEPLRG